MGEVEASPRVVAFVDGQSLAWSLKEFGARRPTFDLPGLVQDLCTDHGWVLSQIRFYTGIPRPDIAPDLHGYWMRRLSQLGRQGVWTWTRKNAYARKITECASCGAREERTVGREKGVDVRIALDSVSLTAQGALDVALFFTQDQDFFEAASEIRSLADSLGRRVVVASAFPAGSGRYRGGIRGTMQIPLSKELFELHGLKTR